MGLQQHTALAHSTMCCLIGQPYARTKGRSRTSNTQQANSLVPGDSLMELRVVKGIPGWEEPSTAALSSRGPGQHWRQDRGKREA